MNKFSDNKLHFPLFLIDPDSYNIDRTSNSKMCASSSFNTDFYILFFHKIDYKKTSKRTIKRRNSFLFCVSSWSEIFE